MIVGDYEFSVDCVSKFYNTLVIKGWFHHSSSELTAVEITDPDLRCLEYQIGLPHGGVDHIFGPGKGFFLQTLRSTDRLSDLGNLEIVFVTSQNVRISTSLGEVIEDRQRQNRSSALSERFIKHVRSNPGSRLLDVGGRSRSKLDRSRQFPNIETLVLDILPGDNVDLVGDAHELSRLFPAGHFDFVYSVSVFEHLLMPWKVACELNAVMRDGAIGLVHTHQTIGMHDLPWDFYRFSDTSWGGLFNLHTGFQLIDAVVDEPQFVIPFLYKTEKEFAERSCGFESSTVMFQKIGPCNTSWDVALTDVIDTIYPDVSV